MSEITNSVPPLGGMGGNHRLLCASRALCISLLLLLVAVVLIPGVSALNVSSEGSVPWQYNNYTTGMASVATYWANMTFTDYYTVRNIENRFSAFNATESFLIYKNGVLFGAEGYGGGQTTGATYSKIFHYSYPIQINPGDTISLMYYHNTLVSCSWLVLYQVSGSENDDLLDLVTILLVVVFTYVGLSILLRRRGEVV